MSAPPAPPPAESTSPAAVAPASRTAATTDGKSTLAYLRDRVMQLARDLEAEYCAYLSLSDDEDSDGDAETPAAETARPATAARIVLAGPNGLTPFGSPTELLVRFRQTNAVLTHAVNELERSAYTGDRREPIRVDRDDLTKRFEELVTSMKAAHEEVAIVIALLESDIHLSQAICVQLHEEIARLRVLKEGLVAFMRTVRMAIGDLG